MIIIIFESNEEEEEDGKQWNNTACFCCPQVAKNTTCSLNTVL